MNRLLSAGFLVTCLILFATTPSQAQFSWKPQPLPDCKTFAITEVGVGYRLTSPEIIETRTPSDSTTITSGLSEYFRIYLTFDSGVMENINAHYAWGGSFFFGYDGVGRCGFRLRIKRWLSDDRSIDFSPGVLLWVGSPYHTTPGFTGSIDLRMNEWLALTMRCEYMRFNPLGRYSEDSGRRYEQKSNTGIYLGMTAGSYPGLAAQGAVGVLVIVAIVGTAIMFGSAN